MVQSLEHETARIIRKGISAVEAEDYLLGLKILSEAYTAAGRLATAEGLSFYGLCLALVEKKYKSAIDFCKKAIELQFYNPYHYANLCKVYLAAGSRKRAYETLREGLRVMPDEEVLIDLQKELGRRERPPISFLSRSHPINQVIGRARHAKRQKVKSK